MTEELKIEEYNMEIFTLLQQAKNAILFSATPKKYRDAEKIKAEIKFPSKVMEELTSMFSDTYDILNLSDMPKEEYISEGITAILSDLIFSGVKAIEK